MINGAVGHNSAHICLGVCTYQRPEMLLRCMSALCKLRPPERTRLSVIIVDNEPEPTSREVVETFAIDGHPFYYAHEPRRGIAQARNAILDKAATLNADWIAMLDDDQIVGPEWLQNMWKATRIWHANVVQSAVEYSMPTPTPFWAFETPPLLHWKLHATWAATCGVLFRAGLADVHNVPLRFDERYALTGGEDRQFFLRANAAGARIIATPEAVAIEFVPASKLSFSAQVARAYTETVTFVGQDREMRGVLTATVVHSLKGLRFLLRGMIALALVPFVSLFAGRGRKQLLKGVRHLARAVGSFVGLLGVARPEQYRTIHGK